METKLRAPHRRHELVHRPRLADRFVGQDHPVLTVVSAPAGFGKTTLLTEWVARSERPAAWLSLEARDSDLGRFWSYVIAAIRAVVPEVGDEATALLQSDPAGTSVAAAVVNDLDAIADDLVIVLDDYHTIESPDVHESVAFLVEHLPSNVHLVIASRSDPPLPLARLRARGDLLEIRAAQLRFTPEEAATYLRGTMGLDLTDDDVRALVARTEGWIAALQLAALSLQGRDDVPGFIATFTGNDRFVVDYLVEEVLERQPPDVRDFLLRTSVLARLTGPLCDAVTGGRGGAATLQMLDRANLFVVPLDDQRRWYRYHHLFGDVLRARLLDERPDEVHELHRRASAWYEANGDGQEAVSHAVAGADFESAARLIELAAPMMRQSRQESTLRQWLEALPDRLFEARPVLSATLVGARMVSGDTTDVEPLLRNAERWIDAGRDPAAEPIVFDAAELSRLPAQVAMYRAGLALLAGDVASTIAHASRIFQLAGEDDHLGLGAACALLGLAHWTTGDLETARARYAAAVEHFIAVQFIPDTLGCSLALADIQLAQGRLRSAQRTLERGLDLAQGQPGLRGTADMHIGLSELHLEHNDLDAAGRHQQLGREHGDAAGLPQHAYRWRAATALLLHARGDSAGALRLLDDAERFYNTDFSPPVRPIPALRARLHVRDGDVDAASAWADERALGVEDDVDYVHQYEYLTLARVLMASRGGDADVQAGVVRLLERLAASAEAAGHAANAIELRMLLALGYDARGDRDAASSALGDALARAAPEGYVRLFLDEGPPMTALLQRSGVTGVAAAHARHILATVRPEAAPPTRPGLVEPLSARETDVLRLLRGDLSGPDIARQLLVSLNTLRTHTKSIYAKLGVKTRREAVRRADELGL